MSENFITRNGVGAQNCHEKMKMLVLLLVHKFKDVENVGANMLLLAIQRIEIQVKLINLLILK